MVPGVVHDFCRQRNYGKSGKFCQATWLARHLLGEIVEVALRGHLMVGLRHALTWRDAEVGWPPSVTPTEIRQNLNLMASCICRSPRNVRAAPNGVVGAGLVRAVAVLLAIT